MANNCNRDSDSYDTTSSHYPVFIDTNLDTHLALIVSDSDTVSVLKKKIMSEHSQCFPNFGEIKINALKVKRKGCFYHLSDSMLVKSVFERVKKCWFVYVDAFSLKEHDDNQFPIETAVSNQLALVCFTKTPSGDLYTLHSGIVNPEYASFNTIKDVLNHVEISNMGVGGEHCNTSVLDTNVRSDLGELQGTHVECHNDKSRNTNGDVHWNDSLVDEEHSKFRPVAKKKRKRESKGAGNSLENKILFSEAISTPKDRILEDSIEYQLKTTTTTSDSLFTEPPDLVAISSSGRKKSTMRNNLLRDQVVTAKPSSLLDVGKEILKENVGIVAKTSDNVSDKAIASGENMQHAKLSETFKVSQKQKHPESFSEVVKRDKLHSPSADSLLTQLPEDVHLVASSGSGKKKNKKKKLQTNQIVNPEPSSLHAVGKESFKENVRIVANNSDKVCDAAIVDEENIQHAKLLGTFEVSQKQKHRESVKEVVEQDKLPSSADSLFTENAEDVPLVMVAGSSSGKKKIKKKKKLLTDQVVNAEPSLGDIGKECSKENVATVSKEDSDKAIDAVIGSEENVQHAILSGAFKVYQMEKQPEPVREVVERNKLPSSSVDSLFTEPPEDGCLVAGCSSGKKKSKKKKLPTDQVVNPQPSSLHDVGKAGSKENGGTVSKDSDKASDAVIVSEQSVQRATLSGTFKVSKKQKLPEPVQEVVERDKLPSSLPGIDASRPDAANEKGKSNASQSGAQSGSKGRKTSKKHHSTNVEEFPSSDANELNNMNKDDICSRHENISLDDHNVETSFPHKSEERRELSQNHDPEAMLSEKCEPLIQGEADMHSKESIVSTNLLESNIVVESGKSASSRRMKVSARKSVSTKQVMSSMDRDDNAASGTSSHIPRFNDYSNGEAKKEESFLSPTGRKVTSKRKTVDTSFVGINGKNDMCGNEAVHKTQRNAEIDVSLSKKAKNNETSAASVADFPVKEQANDVVSLQKNKVNMTRKNAEDVNGKSRKKTKNSQNSAAESLSDLPTREQEVGAEVLNPSTDRLRDMATPSKIKRKTKSAKTSLIGQLTGQDLEHGTNHGSLNPQQMLRTVDLTQVPSSDILVSNSIGRPLQNDDDNASKNSNTTNANYPREVSKCDGDGVNFKDHFVRGERMHEVTPIELVVDNVSEAKGSDRKVKTEKNAKKVVLPSPATSHDPENSLNSYVNQGSDRRSHGVSKASDKKMGKVVNSSRHEKSLLATPGAIFRDGSSESSEEESETIKSDSSTKTPSDNSSSSGYSEERDNKLNLDSPINGIDGAKEKDGGKSITKSQALSLRNVTLDTILRSSSRFKKAKLTASQSQLEDAESQPVDFVPDSQANL